MIRSLAEKTVPLGAAALGVVAIASFLGLALIHIDSNFHVDHVTGAWMGLVAYADDGTLYPPLYADGFFGGTRYGPLGIVLNTAAAKLGGEYLVSGKAVALIVMAGILLLVYTIARRMGCDRFVALATTGAVIATFTALFAGTTIYGDALSVALQLGAIAVVAQRTDRSAATAAGILAALAVVAKPSGLWGAGAVLVWLLMRERRSIPAFAVASVGTAALAFGLAAIASSGRMQDNLLELGGSGFEGVDELLFDTPSKIWDLMRHNAQATLILLPFAATATAVAVLKRRVEIVDVAFLLALPLTLVVMTDVGTGFNHLLDLAVLVPLVVASGYPHLPRIGTALVVVGALGVGIAVSLYDAGSELHEGAEAVLGEGTPADLDPPPLQGQIAAPYFSEDPTVAVERGERPVSLDTFMLLRVAREHPDAERALISRFERREFETVVLIMDLDLSDPWWSDSHLGIDIARAIDRNYRQVRTAPGPVFAYRILEPRT